MRGKRRAAALWLPPLALMVLIFVLSTVPSDDTDRTAVHLVLRKLGHFTEYAALAALWWRALRTKLEPTAALIVAFTIAAGYAVTDEIHQAFVATRVASPLDVLIDMAGAAAALILISRRQTRVPA